MKKRILRKWVVKTLGTYLVLWFSFVATTIDNVLDNRVYDIALLVSSIVAMGCYYLLFKYSNVFED